MRHLNIQLAVAGALLGVLSSIVGSGFSPLSIPFALWSAAPYVLLWFFGRNARNSWLTCGAGAAALAADLGIRASVFIWPRGSTAAVALVFSPAFLAIVVMPAGAVAGWMMSRLWQWNLGGRVAVVLAAPLALALITLHFARPELFPTEVIKRRATLDRIGEPRVVTGSERFESIVVDPKPAWHMTAPLDEEPGEELAIVDHTGASLVNPLTLERTREVAFGGQPGRLWTTFSALFLRPGGRLAVVDTGGGYSKTLVKALDGEVLWEYKPDPDLPPTVLRPADLDRDGVVEFYAAAKSFVARLDVNGREIWRRPATLPSLLAILPPTASTPAWCVGVEYGRRVIVWDADGNLIGERAVTADESPIGAADSPWGRVLIRGGHVAGGIDLTGAERFNVDLGDFFLSHAVGVRMRGADFLAVAATADRYTKRSRILLLGADRRIVYDEILETLPRLFTATLADDSQVLFAAGPSGVRRLSMRP